MNINELEIFLIKNIFYFFLDNISVSKQKKSQTTYTILKK